MNVWYKFTTSHGVFFWGSKITADGDCSHEIKRCLLLERKTMTNLDITLSTKVPLAKAMVFPVVKSCVDVRVGPKKKAEHQRTDAFEL